MKTLPLEQILKEFDPSVYFLLNPDVANKFENDQGFAVKHFIEHGFSEGRYWHKDDLHLTRWDYKKVWDRCSNTTSNARISVAGFDGDSDFTSSGLKTVKYLKDKLGFKPGDKILEIGCGVGRVGKELVSQSITIPTFTNSTNNIKLLSVTTSGHGQTAPPFGLPFFDTALQIPFKPLLYLVPLSLFLP